MCHPLQVLVCGLVALTATWAVPRAVQADESLSEIVVFGDSLSDTGNAFLATGDVSAAAPYFGGRFSNGPVWVEVLARELGLPAPAPFLAGGANYAVGGSETGDGMSFFGGPNVGLQIELFLTPGRLSGDELIVVFAGSNDLAWQPPYSPDRVARNLCEHITTLAAAGGTTFLVPNLPSPGQNPANRGTSKEVFFDALTAQVNRLLERRLPQLARRLGITIVRFDLDGLFDALLQRPGDFGPSNVTDPACPGCGIGVPSANAADTLAANPDEFAWWDFVHPTRVVHEIVGQSAAGIVSSANQP